MCMIHSMIRSNGFGHEKKSIMAEHMGWSPPLSLLGVVSATDPSDPRFSGFYHTVGTDTTRNERPALQHHTILWHKPEVSSPEHSATDNPM